jgi:hypothetical protein
MTVSSNSSTKLQNSHKKSESAVLSLIKSNNKSQGLQEGILFGALRTNIILFDILR